MPAPVPITDTAVRAMPLPCYAPDGDESWLLYYIGPMKEFCNQVENPKQNLHATLPEHSQNQLEFPARSSHRNKLSVAIRTHTSEVGIGASQSAKQRVKLYFWPIQVVVPFSSVSDSNLLSQGGLYP